MESRVKLDVVEDQGRVRQGGEDLPGRDAHFEEVNGQDRPPVRYLEQAEAVLPGI